MCWSYTSWCASMLSWRRISLMTLVPMAIHSLQQLAQTEARICSYECTFCAECVEQVLRNVCPNCGGGFTPRPIRPATEHRTGVGLACQPASTQRVRSKFDRTEIDRFATRLTKIPPRRR